MQRHPRASALLTKEDDAQAPDVGSLPAVGLVQQQLRGCVTRASTRPAQGKADGRCRAPQLPRGAAAPHARFQHTATVKGVGEPEVNNLEAVAVRTALHENVLGL